MGSFKCIPHDVAKCIPHDVTSSSISILPYFNRLGGSTRSWRLRIFVQVVSTMVSYCFFSVKRLGRTKLFGLACKKTTLFVDFWMKLVEAPYASECRRFCRVFYNTCFCFFRFRLELREIYTYSEIWRSFCVKLSRIHYQTCREYRTILSSFTWNHIAVLVQRKFHRNS